ncbi:MAG: threonine synthase [bacterium]
MRYLSTRGGMAPASFREILLEGLAPDGGLAMPESCPQVDRATLARWRGLDYPSLAFEILSLFIDDIPPTALRSIVERTYRAEVFGSDAVTPLIELQSGLHLLQLSNGPTLAFKDVAMQLLGNLFEFVLAERGESLNILGATSGDTGSAAEYAMRGKRGIRVFMLSPHGAMSPFQTAQMFSLMDPNIHNIAIRGVFDDCQDIVKAVSADLAFKARYRIGTVNSINWARLVAQVVYYFKGYFAATRSDDETVSFCVPSGNFGNICAGHVARRMGLPVHRLILATNENNVLDEFFRTGTYRPRSSRETRQTSSPSMDISKASNFERYVYDLVGGDGSRVRALWREIDERGAFDLAASGEFAKVAQTGFVSGHSTHADRLRTIRSTFEGSGRIVDTHTADGIKVALELREPGETVVCLETALPVKFEATILEALGRPPSRPSGFEALESAPLRFEVMDADTVAVKRYIEARCAD